MTRLLMALSVLWFLPLPAFGQTYYSYAFGKQYGFAVTDDDLKKCPAWEKDAENPPLSAKKAIEAATKMKDSLVKDTKDFKWTFVSATLQPVSDSKWVWMVHFDAVYRGPSSGIPNHLRIVVHMNGTAVQPQVREDK